MRRLAWFSLLLACLVVPLGAYVRLSDAGLGCPDWPGCYGRVSPHHARADILRAESANPAGPVSLDKAWKEMTHRYAASLLGVCILLTACQARRRRQGRASANLLLAAVLAQGLLGMLTVALLLKPAVVTLHLLLGMSIVATLAWRALSPAWRPLAASKGLRRALSLLVLALLAQVALGGWVSSSHAALACQGFPACNGEWWPAMRFDQAFHWLREAGEAADGAPLAGESLIAVHWLHRLGALLVSVLAWRCAWLAWREAELRAHALLLIVLWAAQVGLGMANVLLALPLPVAVAHNTTAMLLLACVATLLGRCLQPAARRRWRAVTPRLALYRRRDAHGHWAG